MAQQPAPNLHVVTASTRPGRQGPKVAEWFLRQAREYGKFNVESIDLATVGLPIFNEPKHPRLQQYEHEHTRAWSAIVARADAFVFVTPEYDFSPPASLLNALQFLAKEWAYKPAGFVSYGGASGGLRSVQMTKQTVTALKMMPVPEGVSIPFFSKYIDGDSGAFDPGEAQAKAAVTMLDELLKWTRALQPMRG